MYLGHAFAILFSLFSSSKAYRYLPESVENFLSADELELLLKDAGFKDINSTNLTFGITTMTNGAK